MLGFELGLRLVLGLGAIFLRGNYPRTSLHKFHRLKKKQRTQLKTKQVKQDILNQWATMDFPKLSNTGIKCGRR